MRVTDGTGVFFACCAHKGDGQVLQSILYSLEQLASLESSAYVVLSGMVGKPGASHVSSCHLKNGQDWSLLARFAHRVIKLFFESLGFVIGKRDGKNLRISA